MTVSSRHIFRQRAPVAGLARVALASVTAPLRKALLGEDLAPSAEPVEKTVPPPSRRLIQDYLDHVGAASKDYRGLVPPHLFPQWSFDLIGRTLSHLTLPLHAAVNGGCRLEVNGLLPATAPLEVSARLAEVDESPGKIRMRQIITTGPSAAPETIVAHMHTVLVRRGSGGASSDEKTSDKNSGPQVPDDARKLENWSIPADAGLDFAKLTGDFNPIHWIRPAAEAAGFDNTILHGFSTMARAWEGLRRHLEGLPDAIETFDIRFTRPLVLPATPSLWIDGDEEAVETDTGLPSSGTVAVGDAPGERPYMIGSYGTVKSGSGL